MEVRVEKGATVRGVAAVVAVAISTLAAVVAGLFLTQLPEVVAQELLAMAEPEHPENLGLPATLFPKHGIFLPSPTLQFPS